MGKTSVRKPLVKKTSTTAQMDMANRAHCYALRNPPPGVEKTPIKDIIKYKMVKKMDGKVPMLRARDQTMSNE